MHATNMLLGKQAYTPESFARLALKSFETFYGVEDAVGHDYVEVDGMTAADWAVEKASNHSVVAFGMTSFFPFDLFGCNDAAEFTREYYCDSDAGPGALVFDRDHVWAMRMLSDNSWVVLDSRNSRPRRAADPSREMTAKGRNVTLFFRIGAARRTLLPAIRSALQRFLLLRDRTGLLLTEKDGKVRSDPKPWVLLFASMLRESGTSMDTVPKTEAVARARVHSILGDMMGLIARYTRLLYWCNFRKEAETLGTFIRTNHLKTACNFDSFVSVYHGVLGSILGRDE